ncbi:MAG: alpha/beta fold hydrolase [Trueperaceae bacterium]|nr:MAG: alpha/beta fold hydrolase [Trueperaceae bacterium]
MILSQTHIPGLQLTRHAFELPLDHAHPDGARLHVFAREVVAVEKANDDLPWLLYLQGGPGGASPRPTERSGWLGRAVEEFRVLLLDQRGTGASSPATAQTLAHLTPEEQAAYLSHFRADAIVRDAEVIRGILLKDEPWSVLGQSFGGFCAFSYLSFAPKGLREVFITGGIPAVHRSADEVYRACYRELDRRNTRFFTRYPEARTVVNELATQLANHDVRLPDGSPLTVRRLQHLGIVLGASDGAETLWYLLEDALVDTSAGCVPSVAFLHAVQGATDFSDRPIYALLHEAIYAQEAATRWSAERLRPEFPELDDPAAPGFTGEMIYPWMFDEIALLRPLKTAAEILATKEDWPPLYHIAQLAKNTVPVAAAVYAEDLYVPVAWSLETAETTGNVRVWQTNEYEHNGLRVDGARIFERLLEMVRGKV